ncbi:hypothetical protein ACLOJK_006053 [Asimina triloba]
MEKLITILQALPRRRELKREVTDQPTGVAGDDFNNVGDELDNVVAHMLRDSNGILATQSSLDASRDYRFFRRLDEKGQSRSGVESESEVQYESNTYKHGDIVMDFGELGICGLKEAALRRDLEVTVMKRIQVIIICILAAIICYPAM